MSNDNFSDKPKQPSHLAFTVNQGKEDQGHWARIGAAWPAKDDGLTLQLDAIPRDGRVVLRSREQLERLRSERAEKIQAQDHGKEQTH